MVGCCSGSVLLSNRNDVQSNPKKVLFKGTIVRRRKGRGGFRRAMTSTTMRAWPRLARFQRTKRKPRGVCGTKRNVTTCVHSRTGAMASVQMRTAQLVAARAWSASRIARGRVGTAPLLLGSVLLSLLLVLLYTLTKRRRHFLDEVQCPSCRGYGMRRCSVCDGRGTVQWEGKFTHVDPCPLCFGRRVEPCPICGGIRTRKLWAHCKAPRKVEVKARNRRNKPNTQNPGIGDIWGIPGITSRGRWSLWRKGGESGTSSA